ncbi:MAG: HDIG domain-containing protein [archaeon]|nr:MAG: HDIG domain-containing protein [archaeon]
MDPLVIIRKYYEPGTKAYRFLVEHSKAVTEKALEVARRFMELHPKMKIDLKFIEEAAMLHDIGVFLTDAPEIGCHGKEPYVGHGWLGAELLRREGLPRHALVCERHVGTGIKRGEVEEQNLPLPRRDMMPETPEEKIVCFADKFFSKSPGKQGREHTIEEIRKELARFGKDNLKRFDEWLELFGYE